MRRLRALSVAYVVVALLLDAKGEPKEAAEMLEKSLVLQRQVSQRAPGDLHALHDLSRAYHRLAKQQATRGARAQALEASERGLAIAESLARLEPRNVMWQVALADLLRIVTANALLR